MVCCKQAKIDILTTSEIVYYVNYLPFDKNRRGENGKEKQSRTCGKPVDEIVYSVAHMVTHNVVHTGRKV